MIAPGDIFLSVIMLLYVIAGMGVVYVVAPWIVLGRQPDLQPFEKFWCALLFGSAYWIALVLSLAPLRFHDTVGLLGTPVVLYALYMWRVRKLNVIRIWEQAFHRFVGLFFDAVDETGVLSNRYSGLKRFATLAYWKDTLFHWPAARVLIWAVFLYGAYVRVFDSVTHYSYAYADPYVHLVWLKQLNAGKMFADGVYPRGLHAFLSALGTLTGIEPPILIRFCGGVMGSLLPLSIYFLLLESGLPWTGSLVGSAFIAVCTPFMPDLLERQMATLPEEFALVYALTAVAFGIRYLRGGNSRDFYAFCAGSFVVWASHSLVAIPIGLAAIAITVDFLLRHERTPRRLGLLTLGFIAALILGNLQLVLGRLLGYQFHGSSVAMLEAVPGTTVDTVDNAVAAIQDPVFQRLHDFLAIQNGVVLISLVSGLLLIPYGLARRRQAFPTPAFYGIWAALFFLLILCKEPLQLPVPVPTDRMAMFLTLPLCGIMGWLYTLVIEPLLGRKLENPTVRTASAAVVVMGLAIGFFVGPSHPVHPQYEEETEIFYDLSATLPRESWTIVGNNEDYDLALNRGYHMPVDDFLNRYPPDAKSLQFPTQYMFIIVEKKRKQLPAYFRWGYRMWQESLLMDWVRVYVATHHDLRIYLETDNVAIYVLTREPTQQENRKLHEL